MKWLGLLALWCVASLAAGLLIGRFLHSAGRWDKEDV